jgi:N utilization substance protein A
MEKIAGLLEKKAEGRPLPPEDYDYMASFIDRVEKRVEKKRREEDKEEQRRYEEALATVPELTFEIDILDVDLKEHILYILQEAGIETLGDLVLQMRLDPDRILALNGIGPKSFEEISELTDALRVTPEEATPVKEAVEEEVIEEAEPEPVLQIEETPEEVEEPEIAEEIEETPKVVEPVKKEEPEEVDEFDKLFSYDASKYGYYEPEPSQFTEDDDEDLDRPSKKKKRKKRRPPREESEDWENW